MQRENDLLKSANANMESDLNRLKNRLKVAEDTLKELKNSLNHVKAEVSTNDISISLVKKSTKTVTARTPAKRLQRQG